jgi:ADP-ribosylglycohydrolase
MYRIDYKDYLDKVHGGWLGKCLGGAAGAPVEGFKRLNDIKDFKEIMNPELPNDDLDMQLLWLEVLQKKGLDISGRILAAAWDKSCWYPMMEYGLFLKNYERGIYPPYSGEFNNPMFRDGNGCPIRSEIWGFIFPGNPDIAAKYAGMDGSLDHCGNSVWIEQFFAAVESMAFFEKDIIKLINMGLKYIPEDSRAFRCVREMLKCHERNNNDWLSARTQAIRLFGHNDATNSTINLAFVLIGLLFGNRDMENTINIALKCGYDSDCTCATAVSILGTIIGYENIDEELRKLVKDKFVIGIDIKRENNSIGYLAKETCLIGIEAAVSINSKCEIIGVPEDVSVIQRTKESPTIVINTEYGHNPAIGYDDSCDIRNVITNNTGCTIDALLEYKDIPEGWKMLLNTVYISIPQNKTITINNTLTVPHTVLALKNTNILKTCLSDRVGKVIAATEFGIAGASVWRLAGPYIEALEKAEEPDLPSPHPEGCLLPTMECIVNNAAYLDREYINESSISESILKENYLIINAYEDMIPVDDVLTYCGQGCVYLLQDIISPNDREVFLLIGNNDGYKLWVNDELMHFRDEIRLWTPYNNSLLVKLKQGKNTIALKLLKRTDSLKYSIGIRGYNGKHWHNNRWFVDFVSSI